jgi:pyruvate dehydrogenase E1 component beta subunit
MARLTINEAIVAALRSEMSANPRIFCLGQDIGQFGGAMQTFKGLWDEFGNTGRIIDAPISEEAMVAAGAGAAMCGMRPVIEIMFSELLNLSLGPLLNEIGQVYVKSDRRLKVPMVIRTKCGVSPHRGHAEDYHAVLTAVPGIKVVMPSEPRDAMGLMRAALRDDNPVVFFEHMGMQHARRAEVPDDASPEGGRASEGRAGDRLRSDRPAHAGAARYGDDSGVGKEDRPSRGDP